MTSTYRANWNLAGLMGPNHVVKYGETIDLTTEEAAPYVGNVLSLVDAPPASSEPTVDAGADPASAPTKKGRKKGRRIDSPPETEPQ